MMLVMLVMLLMLLMLVMLLMLFMLVMLLMLVTVSLPVQFGVQFEALGLRVSRSKGCEDDGYSHGREKLGHVWRGRICTTGMTLNNTMAI